MRDDTLVVVAVHDASAMANILQSLPSCTPIVPGALFSCPPHPFVNYPLFCQIHNEREWEAFFLRKVAKLQDAVDEAGGPGAAKGAMDVDAASETNVVAAQSDPLFQQCEAYLQQGAALDVAAFTAWFEEHNEKGAWIKEANGDGETLLYTAISNTVPEAAISALMNAWPEGVKETNNDYYTPMHIALETEDTPEAVVSALMAAWPVKIPECPNA